MLYAVMGIQFFDGPDEWARGNALWVKQNTEALAQQSAQMVLHGSSSVPSWFGAFAVGETGDLELVSAWHLGDDGVVREGLPDTPAEPATPDTEEPATPDTEEPATPPSEEYSLWVQPQGSHDAYQIGDIVEHNGSLWISTVEANTWEPGVYGWEVYNP